MEAQQQNRDGDIDCAGRSTQTEVWPGFLDGLNSDPPQAAHDFYVFATKIFEACPPRVMRSVSADSRSDLVQDIVVHCIENDFRVLRQYRNQGKPFAAWFYFIARNKIVDYLKASGAKPYMVRERGGDDPLSLDSLPLSDADSDDSTVGHRQLIGIVRDCMAKLDEYCQLLLKMAADEFVPREMVSVLGWPAKRAKKVSDDLRYCRQKLVNLLGTKGIDPMEAL